ncbi:MAG: PPOX class F420-dependent enzyme [Candidatus Heimdallarchaeota archaeon]|nr:PPOX class F420-dependent enzyme [Candidatus Heimdallarchaeota archaeon]
MPVLKEFKDLLMEKPSFANLAIIRSNGKPHVSPVWFDMSDIDFQNQILNINTAKGRVKANNLSKGASVALSILDSENGYRYLGIEGEVIETIVGEIAEKHIDSLAQKYLNQATYPYSVETDVRIKILIKIDKVTGNNP